MKISFCMSILLIMFSSIISSSSISNIWAIIGQLQLLFFLILTRSNIPKDVIDFITGSNYILLLFNFIPLSKAQNAISWLNWINYDQNDYLLDKIGIQSGSTYVNNFSLFIFLFFIIPPHLIMILIFKKFYSDNIINKCKKFCLNSLKLVINALTLGYYVRSVSESYQFLCLSSFSEIINFSISSTSYKISLSIAFLVAISTIIFFCFVCWLVFSNKEEKSLSHRYFIHYYKELKENKADRFFLVNCVFRRLIFSMVVIFIPYYDNGDEDSKIMVRICIILGLQILYLLYSIIKRPFKTINDNIVLIINELFFCLFVILILCFNKENSWSERHSDTFIALILCNSLIVLILIICINLIQFMKKCITRKKINRIETMQHSVIEEEEEKKNNEDSKRKYSAIEINSRMNISIQNK